MLTLWSDMDQALWNRSLANLLGYERPRNPIKDDVFVGVSRMNLIDRGSHLEFVAELAGVGEKDIDLDVRHDSLSLKASRKAENGAKRTLHLHERSDFEVQRSISLPVNVSPQEATARFKDGILRVTLPKAPESKPRKIQITSI